MTFPPHRISAMTDAESSDMQRQDHASLDVIGVQMATIIKEMGKLEAAMAENTARTAALEKIVLQGTTAVRVVGALGVCVVALYGVWPVVREWLKGQMQ